MQSFCGRYKKRYANSEIKFALGKYTHSEGNMRYHEGLVLSVPVCEICFSRLHDGDPVADKVIETTMIVGGILAGIAGIVYVQFVKHFPNWSFSDMLKI